MRGRKIVKTTYELVLTEEEASFLVCLMERPFTDMFPESEDTKKMRTNFYETLYSLLDEEFNSKDKDIDEL